MRLPPEEQKSLIKGLLPLLPPKKEKTQQLVKCKGAELLKMGHTVDYKERPINPKTEYVYPRDIEVSVNHERRLRHLIERAKNMEEMNDFLAIYLSENGLSKEAIRASIDKDLNLS